MLKVSILTIGDEICIGQIINTNAAWIASKSTQLGANVIIHSSIGDNKDIMMSEFDRLIPLSDILIITGGLGPTHDDITKQALAEYFDDELVLHRETLHHLKKIFELRGYNLTERNKEQAILPANAKILTNALGTAPGMMWKKNGKYIVSLPGVPAEMRAIMTDYVLTLIQSIIEESNEEIVLYKTLRTTGIPESKLADLIGKPDEMLDGGSLAFLPSYRGVNLRIGVRAENFNKGNLLINKICEKLYKQVGKFIYGENDESLSSIAGNLLSSQRKTVSIAESCTGGLLGAEFTNVSGSSEYFKGGIIAYSNEVKEKILGVKHKTVMLHGAVSEQTACEMASGVREKFSTDLGISITGVAGPKGGTVDKPVGTVWIALADISGVEAKRFLFGNDREVNRERAVGTALAMLLNKLKV